jgi:hypothetical protein
MSAMLAHACKDMSGAVDTLMLLWTFCKNHAVPVSKNARSTVEVYKTFIWCKNIFQQTWADKRS